MQKGNVNIWIFIYRKITIKIYSWKVLSMVCGPFSVVHEIIYVIIYIHNCNLFQMGIFI